MDRLEEQFGDQVEFRRLNVDHQEARDILASLGIRGRSQYILLTTEGEFVKQWTGPIGPWEEAMVADFQQALSNP